MKIATKYDLPVREMNFVNVNLDADNKLFIDPMKIRSGKTDFHKYCFSKIEEFVELLIELARNKDYKKLLEYIDNFYERNYFRHFNSNTKYW